MGITEKIKSFFATDVPNLENESIELDDALLQAFLDNEEITKQKALSVPGVASSVDLISSMVASMPIRLYKRTETTTKEITNDRRTVLLNSDTGDTMTGYQLKKNLVRDYLLDGNGYAVVRKVRNDAAGIYYVESKNVVVHKSADPVFKSVRFSIGTRFYNSYEVIKLLRDSTDGAQGKSVISDVTKVFETAYATLLYQLALVKTGGNKKGFVHSDRQLSDEAITALKSAWRRMYTNNSENVVILNKGLEFKESSSSSVEMQINESKTTLTKEVEKVFHIYDDFDATFKAGIYPIIKNLEAEINSVLLLENEKKKLFFAFDIKEITKAELLKRYQAHQIALSSGWVTKNEIRAEENLDKVDGLDLFDFGLAAVLFDPATKTFFTPNTGQTTNGKEETKENNDEGEEVQENVSKEHNE